MIKRLLGIWMHNQSPKLMSKLFEKDRQPASQPNVLIESACKFVD